MKRFGIRNYGPTRQLQCKGQQIFIARDGFIETDDEQEAAILGKQDQIYVTDKGVEFASVNSSNEDNRKVTADDPESLYRANHPEDNELEISENHKVPEISDENEISYDDMTVVELKVLAKDRLLDDKGLRKAEIIELLQAYDAEIDDTEEPEVDLEPEPEPEPEAEEPEVEEPEADRLAFAQMTVKELKVIAKKCNVKVTGLRKAEIIEVLDDYDDENAKD